MRKEPNLILIKSNLRRLLPAVPGSGCATTLTTLDNPPGLHPMSGVWLTTMGFWHGEFQGEGALLGIIMLFDLLFSLAADLLLLPASTWIWLARYIWL